MKKSFICSVFGLFALLPSLLFAIDFRRAEGTLDDAFAASCRVNVRDARGSGTFIGEDNGKAYILTNYHVVTNNESATVDFWTSGVRTTLAGRVAWRYYDAEMPADFALVVVDAQELKDAVDPPFVALGGKDARPDINSFILSAGAPKGRNVSAWRGKVVNYYNNSTAIFQPAPVPGQSGSAILKIVDGELFQVGVLTWLIGQEGSDSATGGAIPVANLYAAVGRRPVPAAHATGSPIPPDATECATSYRHVVELVAPGCPACDTVAPVVDELKKRGVNVKTFDATLDPGVALARKNNVAEVPTFLVFNDDGTLAETVAFDVVKRDGADAILRACEVAEPDALAAGVEEALESLIQPATSATALSLDLSDLLVENDEKTAKESEKERTTDFRLREPVLDAPTASRLFDDAEARWRSRGSKKNDNDNEDRAEENKRAPLIPSPLAPKSPEPSGPSVEERGTLLDRFADRLARGLAANVAGQLDAAADRIVAIIFDRVKLYVAALARKLFSYLVAIVAVAVAVFIYRLKKREVEK